MNLTVLRAKSYHAASAALIEKIEQVDASNLDESHIVISNVKTSMSSELQILDALGGSFVARVTTFSRLTSELLPDKKFISKQSAVIILTKIISDIKASFVCFKASCETAGFAETVYETITQLKYSNVSPSDLVKDSFPPSIAAKMHDIALIYQEYESFVRGRFADSGTKMQLLIDEIPKSPLVKKSTFYIKDFDYFTVQESLILRQLLIYSKGIVAGVVYGNTPKHERLYLNEAHDTLLMLAKGLEIEVESIDARDTFNEVAKHIADNLFADYGEIEKAEFSNAPAVYCAVSIFDEAAYAARSIKQKVADGARFKDFLVVASDTVKYGYAVSQAFASHGIPYFLDRKKCLRHHAAVRFLMRAVEIKRLGFKAADIAEFAKSIFFESGQQAAFEFENLCLKRNIKYCREPFTTSIDGEKELTDRCNKLLEDVYAALEPLKFAARGKSDDFISQIKGFADKLQIRQKIEELAESQKETDFLESKFSGQVWDKLQGVLDSLSEILGGAAVSAERFVKLLESGLNAAKISVLPLYNDCVVVSELDKARAQAHKHLIVLGANDGVFPLIKKDLKLISDRNVDELAGCGVKIYPKVRVENKRERFNVYQLLIEPRESIVAAYSVTGDADSAMLPSVMADELCRMFTAADMSKTDDNYICGRQQARLLFVEGASGFNDGRTGERASLAKLGALYEAIGEKDLINFVYRKQPKQKISDAQNLLFPKNSVSVTKIETFLSCPYKYFWQNGLKLRPRPEGDLRAFDIGNLVHECAEKFVKGLPESGESDTAAATRAESIFESITKRAEYEVFFASGKTGFVLKRLKVEVVSLCLKLKRLTEQSQFKPYAQEYEFGFSDGDTFNVTTGKGELRLNGKIDRIDVCGDKFIVIDYKTGSEVDFAESELFVGKTLQLPIYVGVFAKKSGLKPAGFYYLQLRESYGQARHELKFKGRTLADENVICAVDNTAGCGKSELLNIAAKEGRLRLDGKNTVTEAQMDGLLQYAEDMVCAVAELIGDGFIADIPIEKACDFCDFHALCGFKDLQRGLPRKNDADVSAQILTEIAKCR